MITEVQEIDTREKKRCGRHTKEVDVESAVAEAASGAVEELATGGGAEIEAEAGHEPSGVGVGVTEVEEDAFGVSNSW